MENQENLATIAAHDHPNAQILQRIRFVLVNPSHPGNVGAVARAMKVMGCDQLHLVAPKIEAVCQHPDAIALASGAQDVLAGAVLHTDLQSALADCRFSVALSARRRDLSPMLQSPRAASMDAVSYLRQHTTDVVAFVFGAERTGLSSSDVLLCQRYCQIPTSDVYNSLNLAQAVQLIAYECRVSAFDLGDELVPTPKLASLEAQHQFFVHLQQGLVNIGFLDEKHPKRLMPRLQRLFGRVGIEEEEMLILRGICRAMCEVPPKN